MSNGNESIGDNPQPTIDEILAEMASPREPFDYNISAGLPNRTANLIADLNALPPDVARGFLGINYARGEDGHLFMHPDGRPMTFDELRHKPGDDTSRINPFLD